MLKMLKNEIKFCRKGVKSWQKCDAGNESHLP